VQSIAASGSLVAMSEAFKCWYEGVLLANRARARLVALEHELEVAALEREELKRRLDGFEAILRAIGQAAPCAPDEDEVAITKLAAAGTMPQRGWVPVTLDVRGQKVIALVCNCEPIEAVGIWEAVRRITRPLRHAV
jgi:hypothetical protein